MAARFAHGMAYDLLGAGRQFAADCTSGPLLCVPKMAGDGQQCAKETGTRMKPAQSMQG